MSVVVVGANHRTAPLELLERMSVTVDGLPKLLHALDAESDVSEAVMLSTCNRTEVYVVAERFHAAFGQVRDFFSDLTFLPPESFAESLYVHHDDHAVRHLFEVSAGLDSAVPGEHEVLGQVRTAWEVARAEGTARRGLNLVFRHALEVGKRARSETRIAHHVTSVSQAAVILAGEHFAADDAIDATDTEARCAGSRAASGLAGRSALVVGAGSMARGMAGFLGDAGVERLVIANRTTQRALDLAESISAEPSAMATPQVRGVGLDALADELADVDVLLTATNATVPVVLTEQVRRAVEGRERPLLLVDIGVPRDIEPAVGQLDGVELLDMDAVAARTEENLAARRAEAEAVVRIVDAELDRFASTVSAREMAPVITALRTRAEALRTAELDRFAGRLAQLEPAEREAVEALTRGIVAKLVHDPTVALKDAAGTGRGDRLAGSLRDLFDLG